jgi:hypothetical protein
MPSIQDPDLGDDLPTPSQGGGTSGAVSNAKQLATEAEEDAGHFDRDDLAGKPYDKGRNNDARGAAMHGAKPRP